MVDLHLIGGEFTLIAVIAFIAGMTSFLSPCVLPIVPSYLAYISGTSLKQLEQNRNKSFIFITLSFVIGLSTVFLILGFLSSAIGTLFLNYKPTFEKVSGVFVLTFGLYFLGALPIPPLSREFRIKINTHDTNILSAYLLGLFFALGWTPCIGPQLGSILLLVSSSTGDALKGAILLGFYAVGFGFPFVVFAVFVQKSLLLSKRLQQHSKIIERLAGALLIITGLLLITNQFSAVSWWLLDHFPILSYLG